MSGVRLIVQADDFGMCPPVTDGVLHCFRAGVVTQTSVMPPAPDASRAMRLARRAGLSLGVHLTLACEWSGLRYHPLTEAQTLRDTDGAFLPGIPELRERADTGEALVELRAQFAAVTATGVRPTHVESHIGVFDAELLAALSAEHQVPCRDPLPAPGIQLALDSLWHLSLQHHEDKVERLVDHVLGLPDGSHMIVAHPATDHSSLRTLCDPTSRRWKWAHEIRISDTAALLDPAFRDACTERGAVLTSVGSLRERHPRS